MTRMKSQLSTKSLSRLKEALPKGGLGKIADSLGLSPSLVSRVLSGQVHNEDVIHEAIRLIREQQEEINRLETVIDKLIHATDHS